MGNFNWIFGLITISMPGGLAIYHYAIKQNNGTTSSQSQDCCCKTQQQNGCSSCASSCEK